VIELRCSRELAIWLGAVPPTSVEDHKRMRASGQFILVRERVTLEPMFWQGVGKLPTLRSSN
jgi:hypothetical protein